MVKPSPQLVLSAYEEQLKAVLKWWDEPARIGAESPLASSYFLSHTTGKSPRTTTNVTRGEALRHAIRRAAASLWDGSPPTTRTAMLDALLIERGEPGSLRYSYLVLELRCFQQFLKPKRLSEIWENEAFLLGSKSAHYRDFDLAVQHLALALLDHLRPALHPEQPQPPALFVGYEVQQQRVLTALTREQPQTILISGAGGTGKTSLAAQIARQVGSAAASHPIFWFTVRPGLNDNLNSLLFALAHFLHTLSASQLWQYLLACGGVVRDPQLALGLVRQDLQTLGDSLPLLCFDELDRSSFLMVDDGDEAQSQLIEFVDSLRGVTPLLLIGQRPMLDSDLHITLDGLAAPHILELWQRAQQPLSLDDADQLYRLTNGNPRLLVLCLSLQRDGEHVSGIIGNLASNAGMQPIFQRVWHRLGEEEQRVLTQLTVFRAVAPDHLWPNPVITSLVERRLIQRNGHGGVVLLPAFRNLIYMDLPVEQRRHLHHWAATLLLDFAELTESAWHFWQGGEEAKAVQVWYPARQREIFRGQAEAARTIFLAIARHALPAQEQQALSLILAELSALRGELQQGLEFLQQSTLQLDDHHQLEEKQKGALTKLPEALPSELRARAQMLHGHFQESLGYPDAALRSYQGGMEIITRLLGQLSDFHYKRSMVHLRQKQLPQARRSARLAECQLQNLFGEIEEEEGRYTDALFSYQKALALAQNLKDDPSIALSERNLANLYARQLRTDEAITHAQSALMIYDRMGDRVSVASIHATLAFTYMHLKQHLAAIEAATQAYTFYKASRYHYRLSVSAGNLAESYLELGDLVRAQQFAEEVVQLNEPTTMPYALFTLGSVHERQQEWESSQRRFAESLKLAEKNEDTYLVACAQRALAKGYQQHGLLAEAQRAFSRALALFEQLELANEVAETTRLMRKTG